MLRNVFYFVTYAASESGSYVSLVMVASGAFHLFRTVDAIVFLSLIPRLLPPALLPLWCASMVMNRFQRRSQRANMLGCQTGLSRSTSAARTSTDYPKIFAPNFAGDR